MTKYINTNYKSLYLIALFLLLFSSCQKVQLLNPETPQVVKITIQGSTTTDLEFLYKDSIVAIGKGSSSNFFNNLILNIRGEESPEIIVREGNSKNIIGKKAINPKLFQQVIPIFYSEGKVYDGNITLNIKGYAMSGELEFLLDGKPFFTGTSTINKDLAILVNKSESRKLEVRKIGEQTPLITKEIKPDIAQQSMNFFFDGNNIVDGVKVAPPTNPNNMGITAQFKTQYTDPASNTLFYTGGSIIDLVFYTRKKGTENTTRVTPEIKIMPEIRISIPTDGTFVNFELPPLADETKEYSFDIVEKGTGKFPYISGTKSSYPDVIGNDGRFGSGIIVKPGTSKLLLISDGSKLMTSPKPYKRVPIPKITDLSEYFN